MASETETPQARGRRMLKEAGYSSDIKTAPDIISRKRGGSVHSDRAEDIALLKQELPKATIKLARGGHVRKKNPHTQVNIVVAPGKGESMGNNPQAMRGMMHEGMHARPPMLPGAGGPPAALGAPPGAPPGAMPGGPPPGAMAGAPPMMGGRPPMGGAPMGPPPGPPMAGGLRPPGAFAKGGAIEGDTVKVRGYRRRKAGGSV